MGDDGSALWVRVWFYTYHDRIGHYIMLGWTSFIGVILRSVLMHRQVAYFGREWFWFSVAMGEA
ncbi:MAG TPA: hypothetical protein PK156_32420 [Polyangium sp.]|nr:hypothetical protein [Polyangium sp.]